MACVSGWETRGQEGKYLAWIDPNKHVLLRLKYQASCSKSDERGKNRARIDFVGANFGGEIDEKAFQFEAPPSAVFVKQFVAPPPDSRRAQSGIGHARGRRAFCESGGQTG